MALLFYLAHSSHPRRISKIMKTFIGRKKELQRLQDLPSLGRASLVVIKGRRRIGKSRLAEEFGKDMFYLPFTGLAPVKGVTAQDQRDHFARQLSYLFNLPPFTFPDWNDGFLHLSRQLNEKPTLILFDEISWMGSKDRTFLPKLKAWWDLILQKHPHIVLILCGSISTWINENILNSTAFFGRITLCIELEELSLPESYAFLNKQGFKGSDLDIFKILSVTGGVPWYLEQINPNQTADENLKRLCFEKGGLFVQEFDRIFHDLFHSRGTIYQAILQTLEKGMCDLAEIRQATHYSKSGSLSKHLAALEASGFVTKHYSWSIKSGKIGKKSLYRLADNYVRFYLKYIEPSLLKIEKNSFSDIPLSSLPGWESMMGFQLENLLLKNRSLIFKFLRIHPQDVAADNPYLQKATTHQKGCQIDYLIQSHTNTLFLCEIKMRKRELGLEVIDSIKEKTKRLIIPKGFGVCPVLLHLGPVSDALLDSGYFYRIINVAELLED